MRVRFEAFCDIPDVADPYIYLNDEFNKVDKEPTVNIRNIDLLSVVVEQPAPPRTDIVTDRVCPVCGFNGEIKIVSKDSYGLELYCPQCKSNFSSYLRGKSKDVK